jgi:FecR protein
MKKQIPNLSLALQAILFGFIITSSLDAMAGSNTCATGEVLKEGTGIGGTGINPGAQGPDMQPAGNVIFTSGLVEAKSKGGRTRILAKGTPVCVGETIVTSTSGRIQIRMVDNGFLSVRPDTRLRIDQFRFDGKEDGTEKSVISLLQGGFRALTGLVGHIHKKNYTIQTPNTTIGIRGTDHEPMFIPDRSPEFAGLGEPGTYDKVNKGGVILSTEHGEVIVNPGESGFVPNVPNAEPVLLKEMPRFYEHEMGRDSGKSPSEMHEGHDANRNEHLGGPEGVSQPHTEVPESNAPGNTVPQTTVPETNPTETHEH